MFETLVYIRHFYSWLMWTFLVFRHIYSPSSYLLFLIQLQQKKNNPFMYYEGMMFNLLVLVLFILCERPAIKLKFSFYFVGNLNCFVFFLMIFINFHSVFLFSIVTYNSKMIFIMCHIKYIWWYCTCQICSRVGRFYKKICVILKWTK